MTSYADKLTKTASSVLDGEPFVTAIKCFPQGHTGRKMGRASLLGAAGAYSVARGKQDGHAIDGEPMPLELAIGLTETRAFVFQLSTMTGKAKLPPVRIVPLEVVTGVASQPGRTLHIKHTLIWLSLRDGGELRLETAQYHAANGEQFVSQLLKTARAMDPPSERAAS